MLTGQNRSRNKTTFLNLYKQHVRCHLEFAVSAWCPWTVSDINLLENVQKRAINMISGLSGTNYEEKLTELNMKTLEQRRIQLDLIQTYKIIHGVDKVNCSDFFNLVDTSRPCSTRLSSCPLNIQLKKTKTTTFQNFYTNRVINLWIE